jgi:histidyl-tRNA synthetase
MAKKIFQSPKGTKDILPVEQPYWHYVEETIRRVVRLYEYERLDLPVFEETELFQRGVGEGTDIVEKEMYTFKDKGGTLITLRPEFTAGIVRAYIQHGMSSLPTPVKVWTIGSVFRYERPQAGRYRQHTQFDIEAIGEQDPAVDFEIMSVAWHLYGEMGFKNLSFQINSIGCPKCRPDYLDRLVRYYKDHLTEICEDCGTRLEKNPLRLLDCKNPQCQPAIESAPPVLESLCDECRDHFQTLRIYLDDSGREYSLNHRLVRGLDYYTKTVFEVWAQGIGAQNAVCGGGRYDGLAEAIGGPPTPAVGFASGMERIVLTLKQEGVEVPAVGEPQVYFAFQGDEAKKQIVRFLHQFREAGIKSIMGFGSRSLKAQLREANRRGARYTIILGEEELKKRIAQIKDMEGSSQESIPWDGLIDYFQKRGSGD